MGTKSASSLAVLEVLDEHNYKDWKVRVQTYLEAQELWQIVKPTETPPQYNINRPAYYEWKKKNIMALHVIQISCGPEAFSKIRRYTFASKAWNTLADMYKPKRTKSSSTTTKASSSKKKKSRNNEISSDDSMKEENNPEVLDSQIPTTSGKDIPGKYAQYGELCEHLVNGDWDKTKEILKSHPNILGENITDQRQTALHMAVFAGNENIVKELVPLMSKNDLKKRDRFGYTALAETTMHGNCKMAEYIIGEKSENKELVGIKSLKKLLPVVLAIYHRHMELARYLYRRTPLKDLKTENGVNGAALIIQAIYTSQFDIALDLIKCEPSLALALDIEKCSPLSALASTACKSRELVFWKKWIYKKLVPSSTNEETRLNIPEEERLNGNGVKNVGSVPEGLRQPVSYLCEALLGIQRLREMKWKHKHSLELLPLMCQKISPSNEKKETDVISVAIFRAIKEGFDEFVAEVLEKNLYLIWARDEQQATVFHQAVLYREENIFMLLHKQPAKDSVMKHTDDFLNNVLHMAGKSTPSARFKCIQGAVLQMQSELRWFKELEDIVHPNMKEERNNSGLTPQELFTREHNDMKNKGEEWMKNSATSCTVVAALIVTIMFAAAFTVPGGNDQNTGLPTFLNKKLFMLFIISDALSLFSSSTSVLMFLGILTSRYAEEDFRMSLPLKMIIGLSALFFSIATMMIAFSSALFLMLCGKSWIFFPVICFASVPVTLFVFMQFPLLVEMFRSTFGHSIFPPEMKKYWSIPIHSGINDVGRPINN